MKNCGLIYFNILSIVIAALITVSCTKLPEAPLTGTPGLGSTGTAAGGGNAGGNAGGSAGGTTVPPASPAINFTWNGSASPAPNGILTKNATVGMQSTFVWAVSNATSVTAQFTTDKQTTCQGDPAPNIPTNWGALTTANQFNSQPPVTGVIGICASGATYKIVLTAMGPGGTVTSEIDLVVAQAPIINFTWNGSASPAPNGILAKNATVGMQSTFVWAVSNATSVTAQYTIDKQTTCQGDPAPKVPTNWGALTTANQFVGSAGPQSIDPCQTGVTYNIKLTAIGSGTVTSEIDLQVQ